MHKKVFGKQAKLFVVNLSVNAISEMVLRRILLILIKANEKADSAN